MKSRAFPPNEKHISVPRESGHTDWKFLQWLENVSKNHFQTSQQGKMLRSETVIQNTAQAGTVLELGGIQQEGGFAGKQDPIPQSN